MPWPTKLFFIGLAHDKDKAMPLHGQLHWFRQIHRTSEKAALGSRARTKITCSKTRRKCPLEALELASHRSMTLLPSVISFTSSTRTQFEIHFNKQGRIGGKFCLWLSIQDNYWWSDCSFYLLIGEYLTRCVYAQSTLFVDKLILSLLMDGRRRLYCVKNIRNHMGVFT